MEIYIDNQFMLVSKESETITLRWKKDTANFSDEIFKTEALKFLEIVKKYHCKRIVVDMREFFYTLGQELTEWRNKTIISVYNEIGVEKFAFITTKPTVQQDNPANTFITQYFSTEEQAKAWINV